MALQFLPLLASSVLSSGGTQAKCSLKLCLLGCSPNKPPISVSLLQSCLCFWNFGWHNWHSGQDPEWPFPKSHTSSDLVYSTYTDPFCSIRSHGDWKVSAPGCEPPIWSRFRSLFGHFSHVSSTSRLRFKVFSISRFRFKFFYNFRFRFQVFLSLPLGEKFGFQVFFLLLVNTQNNGKFL